MQLKKIYQCRKVCVCVEQNGNKFHLFIENEYDCGKKTHWFKTSSKPKEKIEKLVPLYIRFADLMGGVEYRGWQIMCGGCDWKLYDNKDTARKTPISSVFINTNKAISEKTFKKFEAFCPSISAEDWNNGVNQELESFDVFAQEYKYNLYVQEAIKQMPEDAKVSDINSLVDRLVANDHIEPHAALRKVGLKAV